MIKFKKQIWKRSGCMQVLKIILQKRSSHVLELDGTLSIKHFKCKVRRNINTNEDHVTFPSKKNRNLNNIVFNTEFIIS